MAEFIPGLELNRLFYGEVVRPLVEAEYPRLRYSAALFGPGSEVLGYDTPISTDHDWGPRLYLFVSEDDLEEYGAQITQLLRERLPYQFRGFSTHFGEPDDEGVRQNMDIEGGPVEHKIEVWTVRRFFETYLGVDPYATPDVLDWLTFPQQRLLTVTAGMVYHDGLGELNPIRAGFAWYPHDVWLHLLAAQWGRIGQERAFMGRAGDVGDELGSQIIAGRLVRDLMRLCFLMEKKYAPYTKWLGTAFSHLQCAMELTPILRATLLAPTWREREEHLSGAYKQVARMHNALGITMPLGAGVAKYHNRPYLVIDADAFVDAIRGSIKDKKVRKIGPTIGAFDQFVDSTDMDRPELYQRLKALYDIA